MIRQDRTATKGLRPCLGDGSKARNDGQQQRDENLHGDYDRGKRIPSPITVLLLSRVVMPTDEKRSSLLCSSSAETAALTLFVFFFSFGLCCLSALRSLVSYTYVCC